MQWGLSLSLPCRQGWQLLLSRPTNCCLFPGILLFGISVISGCSDSNYHNGKVADPEVEISAGTRESKQNEYIIVLVENASIESAMNNLQKYDAQVIRDLKRGRYLIGLGNDPGIEQLAKDVKGSEQIKQIQPNFSYSIQ